MAVGGSSNAQPLRHGACGGGVLAALSSIRVHAPLTIASAALRANATGLLLTWARTLIHGRAAAGALQQLCSRSQASLRRGRADHPIG